MSDTLLIFGAGGQIGQELTALAAARGISAVRPTRLEVDVRNEEAVAAAVARVKPRLVINLAAYTAVDKAESEPDVAAALNVLSPASIAKAANAHGVPVLHLSTDYVFDGRKRGAYYEEDVIAPLGVYGRTKADGEAAVRAAAHRHIILRTSWVYGAYRHNFLKTILRLAGEKDHLRVVADQHGCPTGTLDIAEAILAVDRKLAIEPDVVGTFHMAGSGVTTWYDFATFILDEQAKFSGRRPAVLPITTAEYQMPAVRPANSELDSRRFHATFGYKSESWHTQTRVVINTLLGQSSGGGGSLSDCHDRMA